MGLVRGEDVILTTTQNNGVENVQVPFGCARSVTFNISTDFIETSVTESGSFKTFIPSGKQFSGNLEGLVFLDKPEINETRATTTLDLTDIADSGVFPTSGNLYCLIRAFEGSSWVNLFFTSTGTFANFAAFLTYMNNGINSGATGYTSTISGNALIITARSGLGNSMNGNACQCQWSISSTPQTNIDSYFSGGVNGYFPSKISLGWLYDKLLYSELIQLKYYETDDDNHYLQKECNVYIESINETASFDNMVTFTAQFKGNGTPTITYGALFVCNLPTGLNATAITSTSAVLNWTAVTGGLNYAVDYKLSSSPTWISLTASTTFSYVNLTGLTANSIYDYRVRTNCGVEGTSGFASAQFTTTLSSIQTESGIDLTTENSIILTTEN